MKRIPLWHLAVIIVLCVATFANTLSGAFLWDDTYQIVRNPNVRSLDQIPRAFSESVWQFTIPGQENRSNFYRPVQAIVYTLGYWWGGLDPTPYHAMQIAFHVIASVFVYLICIELGLVSGLALLAASLFAAHPIHTEAIAWLASVPDLSCGAFFFAALYAVLRSRLGEDKRWLWTSAFLYFVALLSKEMAITFAPLALLLTYRAGVTTTWARRFQMLIPYGVITGVYFAMRIHARIPSRPTKSQLPLP